MFNDLDYLPGRVIVSDKEYIILTIISLQELSFTGEYLTAFTDGLFDKKGVISLSIIVGIITEHSELFR